MLEQLFFFVEICQSFGFLGEKVGFFKVNVLEKSIFCWNLSEFGFDGAEIWFLCETVWFFKVKMLEKSFFCWNLFKFSF